MITAGGCKERSRQPHRLANAICCSISRSLATKTLASTFPRCDLSRCMRCKLLFCVRLCYFLVRFAGLNPYARGAQIAACRVRNSRTHLPLASRALFWVSLSLSTLLLYASLAAHLRSDKEAREMHLATLEFLFVEAEFVGFHLHVYSLVSIP